MLLLLLQDQGWGGSHLPHPRPLLPQAGEDRLCHLPRCLDLVWAVVASHRHHRPQVEQAEGGLT